MTDHSIVGRAVRVNDPKLTVGITAENTEIVQDSAQIGQLEPAVERHNFAIQNLVQAVKEEDARTIFASKSKIIKAILYRDPQLRVDLQALQDEAFGTIETFKMLKVIRQRYVNGPLGNKWVFIATTDVQVETEVRTLNP